MRLPNTYACAIAASALLTGASAPAVTPPLPQTQLPPSRILILPQLLDRTPASGSTDMVYMPKAYLVTGLHSENGRAIFEGYTPGPVQIKTIPATNLSQSLLAAQRRYATTPPIMVQTTSPVTGSRTTMSATLPGSKLP